ncbi:MAG: CvpA family protein [Bacteroidota bacterium]
MFTPLDIIIIAIIIVGMYIGSKKGIVKGASRFIAIGAGIIGGFRLRWIAKAFYLDSLNLQMSGEMAEFVSFCTAFVAVFILANAILGYTTQGLSKLNIGIDKALGSLLGGTVATLILSLSFILLGYVSFPSAADTSRSALYPYVKSFSRYTLGVGVNALREATQQLNKVGVTTNPNAQDAPVLNEPTTDKPRSIR